MTHFSTDEIFMRRALALARHGRGRTAPNPPVGAVVVQDGMVVGKGWHRQAGTPHAEVLALQAAKTRARGATLYVTLEPCAHEGRTPPCTRAILAAGVTRVVYAVADPHPLAAGGARELIQAGVMVTGGVLESAARELLAPFFSAVLRGRPFVELKMAMTLDGRTADRHGQSRTITSSESLRQVHRMRDIADAVLVGGRTLELDDPLLTCRLGRLGRDPARVILDPWLRHADPGQRIFRSGSSTIFLCVLDRVEASRRAAFSGDNVRFLEFSPDENGWMRPEEVLTRLLEQGIHHVLVEGGARTAGSLMERGVVDRLHFVYAPRLMLDGAATGVLDSGQVRLMNDLMPVQRMRSRRVGPDLWVVADTTPPER